MGEADRAPGISLNGSNYGKLEFGGGRNIHGPRLWSNYSAPTWQFQVVFMSPDILLGYSFREVTFSAPVVCMGVMCPTLEKEKHRKLSRENRVFLFFCLLSGICLTISL